MSTKKYREQHKEEIRKYNLNYHKKYYEKNKDKLRMLDELRLCFIYQYPTDNEVEYFTQFIFSVLLVGDKKEKEKK